MAVVGFVRRVAYRVRQFANALTAGARPLAPAEQAEVQAYLPPAAWSLFKSMARADQRHGLNVLRAVRESGAATRALLQAAALHDCAKRSGGVRLWHRVAVVLLAAVAPGRLARLAQTEAPARKNWRYPLWAHLHHPERGAELAAAAGCEPLAVDLIAHHQYHSRGIMGNAEAERWLAVLQAADDDN